MTRAAPAADFHVLGLIAAIRHHVQGQVRNAHQQIAQLAVKLIGLCGQDSDRGLEIAHFGADGVKGRGVTAGLGGSGLFGSVSYTHLDVYKRQTLGWLGLGLRCAPLSRGPARPRGGLSPE